MAQGWAIKLKSGEINAFSAGIETHGLNPHAVSVMFEAGVDISTQRSRHIDEFKDYQFDYVITVCGHAHENCPWFPGSARVVHVGFDDPPQLAKAADTAEKQLDCYRKVRDEIKSFILNLPENLKNDI